MKQHPCDSLLEAATNTVISFGVSMMAYAWIIDPLFGLHTTTGESFGVVSVFTVISLIRQFALRRLFNGRSVYESIVGRKVNP